MNIAKFLNSYFVEHLSMVASEGKSPSNELRQSGDVAKNFLKGGSKSSKMVCRQRIFWDVELLQR